MGGVSRGGDHKALRKSAFSRVLLSNDDPALHRGIVRIVVIVETAGADDDQVPRLSTLSRVEETHAIDVRAVGMLRMRIRGHVPSPGAVVHEQHTRARRHHKFLRIHAGRCDRECEWIGCRRRRRRGGGASAAPGEQDDEGERQSAWHTRTIMSDPAHGSGRNGGGRAVTG